MASVEECLERVREVLDEYTRVSPSLEATGQVEVRRLDVALVDEAVEAVQAEPEDSPYRGALDLLLVVRRNQGLLDATGGGLPGDAHLKLHEVLSELLHKPKGRQG